MDYRFCIAIFGLSIHFVLHCAKLFYFLVQLSQMNEVAPAGGFNVWQYSSQFRQSCSLKMGGMSEFFNTA